MIIVKPKQTRAYIIKNTTEITEEKMRQGKW